MADGWIKASSDRLPDEYVEVQVYTTYRSQEVGYVDEYGEWHIANGGKSIGVTHWQPLPDDPKEETHD